MDFADQNGEMVGKWATIYQVRVWYKDVSENTTIRCLISNDGGETGDNFKLKIQHVSSDADFRLINAVIYYLPRGEAFAI